jgi:hypothetical protein
VRHKLDCPKLELPDGPGNVLIVQSVHDADGHLGRGDPLGGHDLSVEHALDGLRCLFGPHGQMLAPANDRNRGQIPDDLALHPIDDPQTSPPLAKRQKHRRRYVQFGEHHRDQIGWVVKCDLSDQHYSLGVPGQQNGPLPKPWASPDQIAHSARTAVL